MLTFKTNDPKQIVEAIAQYLAEKGKRFETSQARARTQREGAKAAAAAAAFFNVAAELKEASFEGDAGGPALSTEEDAKWTKFQQDAAQRHAIEWFSATHDNFLRHAQEVLRYKKRFEELAQDASATHKDMIDQVDWAMHNAGQALSNVRFDLAAKAMVELALAFKVQS